MTAAPLSAEQHARARERWARLRRCVARGELESAFGSKSPKAHRRNVRRAFDEDLRGVRLGIPLAERPRKDGVLTLPAAVLQWRKTQPAVFSTTDGKPPGSGRSPRQMSPSQGQRSSRRLSGDLSNASQCSASHADMPPAPGKMASRSSLRSPIQPGLRVFPPPETIASLSGQQVAREACTACAKVIDKVAPGRHSVTGEHPPQELFLRFVLQRALGFTLTGALRVTTEQALRLCVLVQVGKGFVGYGDGGGTFQSCCEELANDFDSARCYREEETGFGIWEQQHTVQVHELARRSPRMRELLRARQALVAKAAVAEKTKASGQQAVRDAEKKVAVARQRCAALDAKLLQAKAFDGGKPEGDLEEEMKQAKAELGVAERELEVEQQRYKAHNELTRGELEVVRGTKAAAREQAERKAREEAERRRRDRLAVSRRMWSRLGTARKTGELRLIGAGHDAADNFPSVASGGLCSPGSVLSPAGRQGSNAEECPPQRQHSVSCLPQPQRAPSIVAPGVLAKAHATATSEDDAPRREMDAAMIQRKQFQLRQQEEYAQEEAKAEKTVDEEAAIAGALADLGDDAGAERVETIALTFGTYTGLVKGGKLHGRGKVTWKETGDEYDGYWRNSRRHGKGTLRKKATGVTYTGDWQDNEMHGRGVLRDPRVGTYVGTFRNGREEGDGTFTFNNGDHYRGGFLRGLFHGWGVFRDAEGNVYEGWWRDGKQHGDGTLTGANGHVYSGAWVEDEKQGQGEYKCPEYTYKGSWMEGYMEGYGVLVFASGATYKGQFHLDKEHGRGKYRHKDGYTYEGDFVMGKRHGYGKERNAGGDCYEGYFVEGLKQGRGKLVFASGSSYDGGWRADRMHGVAVYTYAEKLGGKRCQVEYEDGKCTGKRQLAPDEPGPDLGPPLPGLGAADAAAASLSDLPRESSSQLDAEPPPAGSGAAAARARAAASEAAPPAPAAAPAPAPAAAPASGSAALPEWLASIDVEDADKQLLLKEAPDKAAFAALTEDDLKRIGIKFGPRKKVAAAIQACK